ncbi:phage portal protein [Anaplasmataceae bacterium AB001_6]|nr:phage portal protein [Anaplasmataceae bacterium AB001_6]
MLINYLIKNKAKRKNFKNIYEHVYETNSLHKKIKDEKNFEESYLNNPIVFGCVNLIAKSVSSIPIETYQYENYAKNSKKIKKNCKLRKLLDTPNTTQTRQELFEQIVSNILLNGNSFLLKVKCNSISEIYAINPNRIKIVQGPNNIPIKYFYTIQDKKFEFDVNPLNGECNILHIKSFNPSNEEYGLSITSTVYKNINQYNKSSEWNESLLNNSARPSGVLSFKDNKNGNFNLSEEQYLRLKSQIDEYMGNKNSGKPLLLEGGLEWKEMSFSPKDMDFLENKISNARDIATAFGVPSQLLNIPGENKYNNYLEARICFWENTVFPIAEKIRDKINIWLRNDIEKNTFFDFNKEDINVSIQKKKYLSELLEKNSFMTINEKRTTMGLNPLKGMDIL